MTAKEMFEVIGYKLSEAYSEDTLISYFDGKKNITIEFCIKNKRFRKAKGVFDCVNISIPELKAIQKQCKELGWLEEKDEHFEEKAETNAEHYLNDLLKIGRHFCFMHEKVKNCCDVGCAVCTFGKGDCDKERFKWLASQYKKPTYKLSQFEYDLIQTYSYVHEGYTLSKFKRLIKLKDKGYFKCADYDTKIQDILSNCAVIKQ